MPAQTYSLQISKPSLAMVFFFFLISKKKILLIKARETQKVHGSEQWKKKQQDKNSPYSILIEEIKSVREEQSEKPQQRDQSKRVFWQNSNN